MSFILIYDFLIAEILLVLAGLGYIVFHYFYKIYGTYHEIRKTVSQRVLKRKEIQKKIQQSQRKTAKAKEKSESQAKPSKKVLSAQEAINIEAAVKKVHAKNAVKEFEAARAAIIEGLTVDKNHPELNVLLAQYYERMEDYPKGEIILRDMIIYHQPDDPELYILLGDNLMSQSKPKLAYEIYKQAHKRDETNSDVLFALAELAYETLDYESSKKYGETLVQMHPKKTKALEILAEAYMQLEQYRKAYDTFLKIRKIDPYNGVTQKWIQRLEEKLDIHPDIKQMQEQK